METIREKYEADNRSGINHEGDEANIPVERLTATSIIGDPVENPNGEKLGTIDNLMVNINNGRIEYAVIDFDSFIGIGGKLFAIPFNEMKVDADRKVFIINRNKEYLKNSPGFDKDHWPDTNDHAIYFDNVATYYRAPVSPIPFD
jgi:sporulation protein YlmC with PRC-barrel domain